MKAFVCPFCDLVSAVPHHTQQACIDALREEIARTRQVLERRTASSIAGGVGLLRLTGRPSAPSDGQVQVKIPPRLSVRCAVET
jgi:hypothetical protein